MSNSNAILARKAAEANATDPYAAAAECIDCLGTGEDQDFAEKDGSAVTCATCAGTGYVNADGTALAMDDGDNDED